MFFADMYNAETERFIVLINLNMGSGGYNWGKTKI